MDETGVLLSDLNTVKVLVSRSDVQSCRGVGLRRTMITAVECISADGRYLPPPNYRFNTVRQAFISLRVGACYVSYLAMRAHATGLCWAEPILFENTSRPSCRRSLSYWAADRTAARGMIPA